MTNTAQLAEPTTKADENEPATPLQPQSDRSRGLLQRLRRSVDTTSPSKPGASKLVTARGVKRPGKGMVIVMAVTIRLLTVAVVYVLLTSTIFGVIPMAGAWLHAESGASAGALTPDGVVTFWLVPFIFTVVMLGLAEIALVVRLWTLGSRAIARLRAKPATDAASPTPSKAPPGVAGAAARKTKSTSSKRSN